MSSFSEAWMYRSGGLLADSWISDAIARDTDVLTQALQKSLSDNLPPPVDPSSSSSSYFNAETPAHTFSGSGSDFETLNPPKRSRSTNTPALSAAGGGKITKRKSRASKRNMTTFITADPANFRQMVQQVTGVKFGDGIQMPVTSSSSSCVPLLKPEPQRASSSFNNRLQVGCLPTLDTSAFLLDHHNNKNNQQSRGTGSTVTFDQSPAAVADGGSGFQFGSFVSFPTLESWN